jgi:hypothetical protein
VQRKRENSQTPLYLEPHQLRRVNREFVRYVRDNLPTRFYVGEKWWTVHVAAALFRMCNGVEAALALMTRRLDDDALVLLRSLYEQAVVLAWVSINPEPRHERWASASNDALLKMHRDALPYGQEILSPAEVALCEAARGTPSVEVMARQADRYWPGKVRGLHGPGHWFSFHGLYLGVYRIGSRPAHGSILGLEPYVRRRSSGYRVVARPQEKRVYYSFAAPLLGIALIIALQRVHWLLDERRVRRFVDRATAETARRPQRRQ